MIEDKNVRCLLSGISKHLSNNIKAEDFNFTLIHKIGENDMTTITTAANTTNIDNTNTNVTGTVIMTYKSIIAAAQSHGYSQVFNTYGTGPNSNTSPKKTGCDACNAKIKELVPVELLKAPWINRNTAIVFHKTDATTGKYDLVYACTCGWRKRVNTPTVKK